MYLTCRLYGIAAALALTTLSLSSNVIEAQPNNPNRSKCDRFGGVRFQQLPSNIRSIAKTLQYDAKSWNHVCAGNPMESVRYSRLDEDATTEWGPFQGLSQHVLDWKISKIGYPDAECWDHYTKYKGYTWSEMRQEKSKYGENLADQAKVLGWDRESWNGKSNIPAVDCYLWKDLTELQQSSATNLGYTDKEWDAHTCRPYCNAPTSAPSISMIPSDMPSISMVPSSQPTDTPSDVPSYVPSDRPSQVPSPVPSDVPSSQPTDTPSDVPSISFQPTEMPSALPSSVPTALPSSVPSSQPTRTYSYLTTCDKFRGVRYQKLPPNIRSIANTFFEYNAKSWNHACTGNPIESVRYSRLGEDATTEWGPFKGLPRYIVGWKLSKLGFPDAECWDHFTKYKGYTWKEMRQEKSKYGENLADQAKVLGWDRESWNGKSNIPAVDCYLWKDLTKLQQSSATNLGYTDKEWDAHTCRPYCDAPTSTPSGAPSDMPSMMPSPSTEAPSAFPSSTPSDFPSSTPSVFPSDKPSASPSGNPSDFPSSTPSAFPSSSPSAFPSSTPSAIPSKSPSPSMSPSVTPPDWHTVGQQINGQTDRVLMGFSVALSSDGKVWAGGASYDSTTNGPYSGLVQVYTFSNGSWNQVGSDIQGKKAGEKCGTNVSLSSDGNTLAVVCSGVDKVRVYKISQGNWVPKGTDLVGGRIASLSSDGTIVAVGHPLTSLVAQWNGSVQVYSINGDNWITVGQPILGKAAKERCGSNLSLSSNGNTLAVGCPGAYKARVYKNSQGNWVQNGSDLVGGSVSLSSDGTIVAVGYPEGGSIQGRGAVQVLSFATGVWAQIGSDIEGKIDNDKFGRAVSLSSDGTIVAVGDYKGQTDDDVKKGLVRVFSTQTERSAGWVQLGDQIDGPSVDSEFGWSLSLSSDGTTFVVGAPREDSTDTNAGTVRVYNYGLG